MGVDKLVGGIRGAMRRKEGRKERRNERRRKEGKKEGKKEGGKERRLLRGMHGRQQVQQCWADKTNSKQT